MPEPDYFIEFRETLIFVQDESAHGEVFVAFGQFQSQSLVGLLYLQSARQHVFASAQVGGHIGYVVMLVLDVAEDFLYQILQSHNAACTAELIHHHGDGALLADECAEQFLRVHGFGYDGNILHTVAPVVALAEAEHLGTVDEADDVVDIFTIDNNLGVPALHEGIEQGGCIGLVVNGVDFSARDGAVSHLHAAEVQRILEYLHFILDATAFLGTLYVALYEVVEVGLLECPVGIFLARLLSQEPESDLAERTGELADGPQEDVDDIGRQRAYGEHAVGIDAEECLGQELTGDDGDGGAQESLYEQADGLVGAFAVGVMDAQRGEQHAVDQSGHQYAVDDQGDVVADEDGGDEVAGVVVERVYEATREALPLAVHLESQLVAGQESYLRTREEGGEEQHDDDFYDKLCVCGHCIS